MIKINTITSKNYGDGSVDIRQSFCLTLSITGDVKVFSTTELKTTLDNLRRSLDQIEAETRDDAGVPAFPEDIPPRRV